MHPYTVGLICARGGSKGVPRKNLRILNGKPLIGWAIEIARQCPSLSRVIVSTDDNEIADVARACGAEVPFLRPAELALDNSAELLTWKYCLSRLSEIDGRMPQILVNIPATAPLRAVEDVEACLANLQVQDADLCVTVKEAERNPYFTMVTINEGWIKKLITPAAPIFRRQDAPEVFDIVPVGYAARADYILRTEGLFDGRVCATVVPAERAVDIDTELDLLFAGVLMQTLETAK